MLRKKTLIAFFLILGVAFSFGQPKLTFNTRSIDFGNITVGELSNLDTTSILIANIGTDTLKITSIIFTQPEFSINQAAFAIAPGLQSIGTIIFTPTRSGLVSGWLIVTSNDPTSPDSLPISGLGLVGSFVDAKTQAYRDEPKGNAQYKKEGVMNGNRINTVYRNDGEVGYYQESPSAEWPKGSGRQYLDGTAVLVASKITAPGGQTITPLESAYREEVNTDPKNSLVQWIMQPVPGYVNPSSTRPAVNRDTTTFPPKWPAALGLTSAWDGHWYGYFGLGVSNADFETFFVLDDSQDKQWIRAPYYYYPIASDTNRGGLGLRVEIRGFQWSHVLAEDCIFWHYDIVNISDHNYDTTCFGFYTDPGVGGGGGGANYALYDSSARGAGQSLALTYAWCPTCGQGVPSKTNYKTGYIGYAYLESPGNPYDGIDNDKDLLIDERRDNNIDDNHNWITYADVNHNGRWDPGEPLNDDLGRDGVGPTDIQYTGPDEGEADGIPTHGEPNFDETDKGESDMIGLTAMTIRALGDKSQNGPGLWVKNDSTMWVAMNNGFRETAAVSTNIQMVFASGPFPLKQTKRERFSVAIIFGDNLDALVFNLITVQAIYNANYQFTKPPLTPHLTAIPGDQKVSLFWDNIAESSTDRFYGFENGDIAQGYFKSFEGYTIYRSQEPEFEDDKKITDSFGNPKYYKPIAQFDLVDSISGPDPVGINGARFWRGSNSGIQHAFVDTTVTNGIRYYYALCSYSKGGPTPNGKPLQPTECSKIIMQDNAGNVKFVDINCAVVTPQKPVAGFQPAQTSGDLDHVAQGLGTGKLKVTIINPSQVHEGDQYTVQFKSDAPIPKYHTQSFDIYRTRNNVTDTLIRGADTASIGSGRFTPMFDGMVLSVLNDSIVLNTGLTGWLVGSGNVNIQVTQDDYDYLRVAWPADYEIRWDSTIVDSSEFSFYTKKYSRGFSAGPRIPVNFHIFKKDTTIDWVPAKFVIQDLDTSHTLTVGDTIRIVEQFVDKNHFNWAWKISYGRPFMPLREPQRGDRFAIKTYRPFLSGDYFLFKTIGSRTDNDAAKNQLSQITVVPNPYISTAKWESRTLFTTGRGDRLIQFMKLPAKCTVRIYTITGALVKTLYKDTTPTDGSLAWNLVSDDGMNIAFGLYIFHVDAPGIGEYIGKFAVVK